MRLSELSTQNRLRNQESFPTCADWSATDWATALAGEVGELCNFIKKHRRGDVVNIKDIGKELADVVIYTDLIATYFKIDLETYTANKFNEVSERVGSSRRIAVIDEYEMKLYLSENTLSDLYKFLEEKQLEEEFDDWLHEHDEDKADYPD